MENIRFEKSKTKEPEYMEKQKETCEGKKFAEFVEVVRELREKCPWDREQTHRSLQTCLENETQEVIQAIQELEEDKNGTHLCEELGDLLMQVVFHSILAEENGMFTIEDVLSGIAHKMRFRHPKIFAPERKDLVNLSWEELKKKEKLYRKELTVGKSEKT